MPAIRVVTRVSELDADTGAASISVGTGGSGDLTIKTNATTRLTVSQGGNVSIPDISTYADGRNRFYIPATQANAVAADSGLYPRSLLVQGTAQGNNGKTGQGMFGVVSVMADAAGVVNKTISSWANNGGLFEATTSSAHGFSAGDRIVVYGAGGSVLGNAPPNGAWVIAATPSTTRLTLQGSTFVSGVTGGTVTNRPYMVGFYAQVSPSLDRNAGMSGAVANCDDVTPFVAQNVGTGKCDEAYYVGVAPNISGEAYVAALGIGGKVGKGITFGNAVTSYGIDFWHSSSASYGSGPIRLPNGTGGMVLARNGADDDDVQLFFTHNTTNQLTFVSDVRFGASGIRAMDIFVTDGNNITTGTSNGTQIGTTTSQKIGFWAKTPVVQPTGSSDVLASLVSVGLRAASANPPLDLGSGTLTAGKAVLGTSAATTGVLNIPNASPVYGRNAAGDTDVNLFSFTSGNRFKINTLAELAEGVNIDLGTSTGSKIGTGTSQKLAFFNSTPIVQPTASTDIADSLVSLGLRASPNLDTPTIKASPVMGAAKDVRVFNQGTNQTWNKPVTGTVAVIMVKGAGGGGGGGTTGASSINGGAGGGGGGWVLCAVPLAALASSCNVNVGAGGAGGAAGNAGSSASGTTAFDSAGGNANVTAATGGGAGGAGTPTGGSGGTATAPTYTGYTVTSVATNGGTGGSTSSAAGVAAGAGTGGGGGGGGINAVPTSQAGGAGDTVSRGATVAGAGGAAGGGSSTPSNGGSPGASTAHIGGPQFTVGGGGGGGNTGGSGKNAGAGANGYGGGGGGGGGSCVTGGTAGAGGSGGDGCVIVVVY